MKESHNEDLIKHRIEKAEETINDVEFLLANKKYTIAVNRIYYGMFYILSALGCKEGFNTSKHQQLIGWFNQNFIKTNKLDQKLGRIIHKAYDKRTKGDYDDYANFEQEDIVDSFQEMVLFINELKNFILALK